MTDSKPIAFFAEIQGREEARRHECEVHYVAEMSTDAHRSVYLEGVWEKRGKDTYHALRSDVWDYMKRVASDVIPIQESLAL